MDSLKRKRTQQRRDFTIAADSFEMAIKSKDIEALEDAYSLISEIADSLSCTESAIRDIWCESENFDETLYQSDQDKALEYRKRWLHLHNMYKKMGKSIMNDCASNSSSASGPTVKSTIAQRRVNMPKLELVKFDGNIKNWLLFWGQFKKIHEDQGLEDIDKFQYLLQAMVVDTSARQLVETYPPSGENYQKAVAALKARFARDDLLIETYVRGLLNLVLLRQKGQIDSLSSLYDNLQTHLQALETLGVAKDKYASILLPMIESALPVDILRTWNRIRASNELKDNDLSRLIQFLREEVESEERIQLAQQGFVHVESPEPKPPTACFVSNSKTENKRKAATPQICIWCDKDSHASSECNRAIKLSFKERQDFLRSKKACVICLKLNHVSKRCRSFPKCMYCGKRHVTLMCADLNKTSHSVVDDKKYDDKYVNTNSIEKSKENNMICQLKSTTLLQTLAVKVVYGNKEIYVRVLIDSGAQRSYIRRDLVQRLSLKPVRKELISHCLFGGIETKTEEHFIYNVCLKSTLNNFSFSISAIEQNEICGILPKVSASVIEQLSLKSVRLTDMTCDCPDEIGILIGADFSGLLLTGEVLHLESNLTAINTKMGWTIQGPVTGVFSSIISTCSALHLLAKIDITDLWTLESLGITDPSEQVSKSVREKEILEYFYKTISVNDENRYEVNLPWRDNISRPKPNYNIAKKRLLSTTARLKSLGRLTEYNAVFQEWLKLNIIELAPDQGDTDNGMFLPHHAVIKDSSETTKIRPVFDASAKDVHGISLNTCLEKGTNLIELIPNLLLDFRKEAIGITADIAKAFLQISLNTDDRNYLKFLWWSQIDKENRSIVTYRHRRVVFGVKSSPFHLAATINYHLDQSQPHLMETSQKLKNSFYVDNCVTSVSTEDAMKTFIREATDIMIRGNFDLRCWVTAPVRVEDKSTSISVLGIMWDTLSDTLNCNVTVSVAPEDIEISKRSLLSVSQKVFDPIGLCCPTTIIPKMLLQKAWALDLTWDEELPEILKQQFLDWVQDLHLIAEIKIPRRLTQYDISQCKLSLHVFSDASLHAYSASIFLRSEYRGDVTVRLVTAKSRVTPTKGITMPRLELIAATLATRLSMTVIQSLNFTNCEVYYWTDSSIVLSWIQGDGNWSVFVANRVREINSATSRQAWRHVPGVMNPADLPSRGVSIRGLLESRWWLGPAWLFSPSEKWPNNFELTVDSALVEAERKKSAINAMFVEKYSFLDRFLYFSKYIKIVRLLCWILRIKYKLNRA